MGTRASSASTALSEDKVTTWSDMIYSSIVEDKSQDDIITQEDLLSYEIGGITEIKQLMPVIQRLTSECLFKPVDTQSGLCWKWRSRSDAKKVARINSNETRMVYDRIEDAGADGIWTRVIKARTGLHDTVMKHAIKYLEQNGYITEFKSVEHPHKKLYIISSLRPSEKATGGPWYHDNDLDEGFIAGITKAVFQLVVTLSSYLPSSAAKNQHRAKNPSRGTISGSDPTSSSARGKKRAASAMTEPSAQPEVYSGPKTTYLRPLPAGYTKYPTTREIAQRVALSNIVKDITLSEGDIQQIVDALVFDGRIEPVRLSSGRRTGAQKTGYRVTRPARLEAAPEDENDVLLGNAQEEHVTGMAEIPCGGCPVFEVCQEGNAVSPSSCEYYAKWLENLGG